MVSKFITVSVNLAGTAMELFLWIRGKKRKNMLVLDNFEWHIANQTSSSACCLLEDTVQFCTTDIL